MSYVNSNLAPVQPSNSILPNKIPNCFIIPGSNNSVQNCIQMPFPSTTIIIVIIIFAWLIFLLVAYLIYYFLRKVSPEFKVNYWIILAILFLAGLLISLFSR